MNMLKGFYVHKSTESNYSVEEGSEGCLDGSSDIPVWNEKQVVEPQLGQQLTGIQCQQVIKEFEGVVRDLPGKIRLTEHRIETGSAMPVRFPPYRIPHAYLDAVQRELKEMLRNDIIEPSTSEWAAPVVLAKKRDGYLRIGLQADQ